MATILGSGAHTYEWVEGWDQLPNGVRYGNTHSVQVDRQGRIFVFTASETAVIIFDPDGKVITTWGKEFAAGAHGMQLRAEGNTEYLYLTDTAQRCVVKTTLEGEQVWRMDWPKDIGLYQEAKQYCPTNVGFAPNGDFYVADGYGSSYIHHYDINANYLRSWGGMGSEAGKLDCPHGVWCDTRSGGTRFKTPNVTVADRGNSRLQVFTLDGKHVGFVNEELRRPCHFDERQGDLLIPDLHGRVTIFDRDDRLITHLGDNPDSWKIPGWPKLASQTWKVGKFITPHGACWDRDGNIFVTEWLPPGRVTKLRRV